MTKDTVRLLAAYNAYANEGMNAKLASMDPEIWERGFGGFFGSIKDQCAHIYKGDLTWLSRLAALRPFACAASPILANPPKRDEVPFSSLDEYLRLRKALDALITAFASEITDEDLAAELSFTNWAGQAQVKNFGGLLMHLFNHGTHHRGGISVYLDMAGVENDFSNLIRLL